MTQPSSPTAPTEPLAITGIDTDWWKCLPDCGNQPDMSGFYTAGPAGDIVDPSDPTWDQVTYVCADCGRLIDMNTGEVTGRRSAEAEAAAAAVAAGVRVDVTGHDWAGQPITLTGFVTESLPVDGRPGVRRVRVASSLPGRGTVVYVTTPAGPGHPRIIRGPLPPTPTVGTCDIGGERLPADHMWWLVALDDPASDPDRHAACAVHAGVDPLPYVKPVRRSGYSDAVASRS